MEQFLLIRHAEINRNKFVVKTNELLRKLKLDETIKKYWIIPNNEYNGYTFELKSKIPDINDLRITCYQGPNSNNYCEIINDHSRQINTYEELCVRLKMKNKN